MNDGVGEEPSLIPIHLIRRHCTDRASREAVRMALKIGIVGLNGIGKNHAACYQEDDLADLIAVCDVVKERADAVAEKYGVKAYYSLKDMIENEPDLQIVDVTTGGIDNGSWHFEPAMEAVSYGKHVLVEKPICHDVQQARELVAYADKQKVY
ncbi:MAG: putative oxidoreductase domain protein, partial [Paenibacillus sp.]|nr:putative oxidoreductase domain protein [Paenibacillus sp.]